MDVVGDELNTRCHWEFKIYVSDTAFFQIQICTLHKSFWTNFIIWRNKTVIYSIWPLIIENYSFLSNVLKDWLCRELDVGLFLQLDPICSNAQNGGPIIEKLFESIKACVTILAPLFNLKAKRIFIPNTLHVLVNGFPVQNKVIIMCYRIKTKTAVSTSWRWTKYRKMINNLF